VPFGQCEAQSVKAMSKVWVSCLLTGAGFLISACGTEPTTSGAQLDGITPPSSEPPVAISGGGGEDASGALNPGTVGGSAGDSDTPGREPIAPIEPTPDGDDVEPEPNRSPVAAGAPGDVSPGTPSRDGGAGNVSVGGAQGPGEPEPTAGVAGAESSPSAAVGGSGGVPNAPVATGTPTEDELEPMPIPRGEHGVGVLGDEVYVMCGFTPSVISQMQVYTPETDSWRDAADVPVVCHHPNVATVGDRLYILGFHAGMGQRVADGTSFAYDATADEWTEVASQPPGTERGAACVTTFQDKVYVFGGTNDIALAEASTYDPATDRWEALPLLPMPRHHCIAAVVNDLIYIVSGRDVVIEEVHTESFVFDPVAQTYEEVAPILTPRGGAAGGELGGRIYVFGGEGNDDDPRGIFHEAEVYDPASDTWMSLPDMQVPRHGFGAAVIGDRMYLPGGSTSQGIDSQATHSVFYLDGP
jgi:N-acetylneuraminic acid mutarotase